MTEQERRVVYVPQIVIDYFGADYIELINGGDCDVKACDPDPLA